MKSATILRSTHTHIRLLLDECARRESTRVLRTYCIYVVLGVCGINLYLGSTGTMPGALSALLLRALVLCTIPATTTAAAVVLAEMIVPAGNLPAPSVHTVIVVLGCV